MLEDILTLMYYTKCMYMHVYYTGVHSFCKSVFDCACVMCIYICVYVYEEHSCVCVYFYVCSRFHRITVCTIDFFFQHKILMITRNFIMETVCCQCTSGVDQGNHYPLDTLAKLLITDTVPSFNICSKQPVQVCQNISLLLI